MTRAIVAAPSGAGWAVGVRFRPGAPLELLGVAARELRDEIAPAVDVWGPDGRTLDARLASVRAPRDAIDLLSRELLRRVSSARRPDARVLQAVAILDAHGGELPVPAVAARVGVGERQLERLFDERVGYGPKVFARVVRMRRATQAIEQGTIASWASLASACGYTDQAHLIREFRALTGLTPRVYAGARAVSEIDNPAHDPLATFRP
jgi:AraC-like DNA-binding protein